MRAYALAVIAKRKSNREQFCVLAGMAVVDSVAAAKKEGTRLLVEQLEDHASEYDVETMIVHVSEVSLDFLENAVERINTADQPVIRNITWDKDFNVTVEFDR